MPKAPPDYQLRYPIDFGDIDPAVPYKVVQLYAADLGKSVLGRGRLRRVRLQHPIPEQRRHDAA